MSQHSHARVPRPAAPSTRISSYLLTEYLERLGVEVIFGLCGHTVIGFLDALSKSRIRFVSTRHEQVAAHAADGYARASGKPGVVLSHLGPGLTNAATGVANAALDSIPMVVIAGDVQSYYYGRHPHQEVNLHQDADQSQIYRPFCKRVYRVDRAEDLPRIMERAFHLCQTGRPGPVLVDVPMDFFSADLPVDAFSRTPPPIVRTGLDAATTERIVAGAGRRQAAGALRRRRRAVGAGHRRAGGAGRGARRPGRPHADGEGVPAPRPSAAARPDRVLGHADRQRQVPHRRPDRRGRHPPGRGQLELAGTPGSPSTSRRRGWCTSTPTRPRSAATTRPRSAWSPTPGWRWRRWPRRRRGRPHRHRGALREEIARGREEFAANWAGQWTSDQFPLRPERILSDLRKVAPEDAFIVTDVGWNKNGVGQQFPITVPGTFITPSGLATMGFGAAAVLGVKYAQPERAAIALIGDGGFCAANPTVVATAMEAGLNVVWVVMDNSAFGTIAGLSQMHYGSEFGCVFERDGQPYHVDYAAMARSFGAEGVRIGAAAEFEPALRQALAARRPTLIQVPMENAPTPTPGHWDINDVYRRGE